MPPWTFVLSVIIATGRGQGDAALALLLAQLLHGSSRSERMRYENFTVANFFILAGKRSEKQAPEVM